MLGNSKSNYERIMLEFYIKIIRSVILMRLETEINYTKFLFL